MSYKMLFVNPDAKCNRDIPNISLGYAATHFNVRVVDLNTKPFPKERFLGFKVNTLGISVQSRTWYEALSIKEKYLKRYPNSRMVSVNTKAIDVFCCYPFLKFEEDLLFDVDFSDALPFPNYELFDSFPIYLKNWRRGEWNYPLMTSIGCPFQCIYCAARNRPIKYRSTENCVKELKQAKKKWGIKTFEVLDDCFNLNKDRVIEFCEAIKPLDLGWVCCNGLRADRFDEDVAKAMAESGCFYIGFGIESTDPEVLKTIKKGETIEQIENAIDIAKKYFKRIAGFLIIGLPASSYKKDIESLKWILRKGITAHFSFHVPFEKGIQYVKAWTDLTFYGDKTYPISNVYPKNLQYRIYMMTEGMRSITKRNLLPKLAKAFTFTLLYEPNLLPVMILIGIKRVKRRWF